MRHRGRPKLRLEDRVIEDGHEGMEGKICDRNEWVGTGGRCQEERVAVNDSSLPYVVI